MKFKSKLLLTAATPNVNLRRVMDLVNRSTVGEGSWGIVSPELREMSDSEREEAKRSFRADVRAMGLGYRLCDGVGQEYGQNVREKSYFIPGISLKQARSLWVKYRQWGIIYCGPETLGEIQLMGPDGVTGLGTFRVDKQDTDENWTEVKNRPFVFK